MNQTIATLIVEPRSLVREALVSLMASHSYHVVGAMASSADLDTSSTIEDAPRLVVLSALPIGEAASAAARIRQLWPEAKIILLFERASSSDFQTVLTSEIDGCIPLFASPDTLVDTLQRIMAADLRILVLTGETSSSIPTQPIRQDAAEWTDCSKDRAQADNVKKDLVDHSASLRTSCGLSQREEEILKGVVRGHSNKMIARDCGVTDATIKVHMKSILRKIRVANRTQAAIWAVEKGYGAAVDAHVRTLRPVTHAAAAA